MRKALVVMSVCLLALSAYGQSPITYQVGTITAVTPHKAAAGDDNSSVRSYDVSVKVGNTLYVVLYTEPADSCGAKYRAGTELLVLVGSKTIKSNDISGRPIEGPILNRKTVTTKTSPKCNEAITERVRFQKLGGRRRVGQWPSVTVVCRLLR